MSEDTVEIDREVVEDIIDVLKSVETILSGATAYKKADTVQRYREKLEDQIDQE